MLRSFIAANPYSINGNDVGLGAGKTGDLGSAITNFMHLIFVVIGMLSIIMIIVGGLLYVVSAGQPQRTKQAKEAVLYAVIGIAVSAAAYAIVSAISGAL